MALVEILQAHTWTRGKRDSVALSVGQSVEVPEPVASSMVASGLAKRVEAPMPPPPVVVEAGIESKPKYKKFGGK